MDFEYYKEIDETYAISNFGNVVNTKTKRILKNCLNNNGYYFVTLYCNKKGIQKSIHRLVAEVLIPNPFLYEAIEHIDKNPSNNNLNNLRWCTNSQIIQSNNSSGVTGVHFRKDINKWSSKITINKKYINLGCFLNKEDAIIARKEAEIKYFKEFAPK
jgi:hypothetical protein